MRAPRSLGSIAWRPGDGRTGLRLHAPAKLQHEAPPKAPGAPLQVLQDDVDVPDLTPPARPRRRRCGLPLQRADTASGHRHQFANFNQFCTHAGSGCAEGRRCAEVKACMQAGQPGVSLREQAGQHACRGPQLAPSKRPGSVPRGRPRRAAQRGRRSAAALQAPAQAAGTTAHSGPALPPACLPHLPRRAQRFRARDKDSCKVTRASEVLASPELA